LSSDGTMEDENVITTNKPAAYDRFYIYDLEITADGRAILAGKARGSGADPDNDFLLLKLDQYGDLDTDFHDLGWYTLDSGSSVTDDYDDSFKGLHMDNQNRILGTGISTPTAAGDITSSITRIWP